MSRSIHTVAVVGAGFMGNQIALQAATHGFTVWLHDVSAAALDESTQVQTRMLAEWRACTPCPGKNLPGGGLDLIHATPVLERAVSDAELVIEAIREDLDAKRAIFSKLDAVCGPETILGTNSSSLRVSRIENATGRADRVLNMHFVHPVWKHPFVELMRGSSTSDETFTTVEQFAESIGLIPIRVRRENTGFVYNCIWRAVKRESLRLVDQGIATVEDVDRAWMIKMESPMGPFALMDRVGLDVVRDIELVYHEESGDAADAPPELLLDKIANHELGVKTGKGFYTYPNPAWQDADFCQVARDKPTSPEFGS